MNELLKRQIKKFLDPEYVKSEQWERFFEAVSETYDGFDADRSLIERSLELSSNELREINERLSYETQRQKIVLDKLKLALSSLGTDVDNIFEGTISKDDATQLANLLITLVEERNQALFTEKQKAIEADEAYKELREKTEMLERFNKVVVDREFQMIKLKDEVNFLLKELGKSKRYNVPDHFNKEMGNC